MPAIPSPVLQSQAARPKRRRPLISLTPLIDVVFILLIFFMLSTSLVQWRTIDLPAAAKGANAEHNDDSLVLDLLEDGSLQLQGVDIDAGQVVDAIRRAVEAQAAQRLFIRPHAGVKLQQTIRLLDRIAMSGVIQQISMARTVR